MHLCLFLSLEIAHAISQLWLQIGFLTVPGTKVPDEVLEKAFAIAQVVT